MPPPLAEADDAQPVTRTLARTDDESDLRGITRGRDNEIVKDRREDRDNEDKCDQPAPKTLQALPIRVGLLHRYIRRSLLVEPDQGVRGRVPGHQAIPFRYAFGPLAQGPSPAH